MNKYQKNIIWLNLEKIITFTIVVGMIILTIACATSCSTSQYSMKKKTYDNKTGLYHQKNAYEPWSIK
jgi:hypothetical protein